MKKFNKKMINVVTTAALAASVLAPMAAFADSKNIVTAVPTVASDYESKAKDGAYEPITSILLNEENVAFTDGNTFRLTLPTGVKFVKDAYDAGKNKDLAKYLDKATVVTVTDQTLELKMSTGNDKLDPKDQIIVPIYVKVENASGAVAVTVDGMDSTLTSGTYNVINVGSGKTTASVESVKTIGETNQALATIRIDENSINAVGGDKQEVTLTLPSKFKWETTGTVEFSGGLNTLKAGNGVDEETFDAVIKDNVLTIKFNPKDSRTARGTIYVKGAKISAKDGASFGDVELSIDGDKVTSQDLLVAKYADYGVTVTAADAKTVYAGSLATDDVKAAKITIKESVKGSITNERKTKITLPAGVKVIKVEAKDDSEVKFADAAKLVVNKDQNEIEFTINSTTDKVDFGIEMQLSVQADFAGDIVAKITGRAGIEGELVIAKAVAPVTVEATATDVLIGVKDQKLGDIVITEARRATIKDELYVTLPAGYKFGSKPKVEVLEGNITIDDVELAKVGTDEDRRVVVKVKNSSSRPSKIKLVGGTITLDRTVPYGAINAEIGGKFVENSTSDKDVANKFTDKDSVAKVAIANVVTPVSGVVSTTAVFTIDSASYKVNGVEKTADVAPFIQDGRTFLPIRFVAEAIGVSENNVIWNANTKTVTLIKGDRIAQIQIGSRNLVVNGVSVPMDTVAFVKDGRTVLPLRYAAQALGAEVQWDEATRAVTIKN